MAAEEKQLSTRDGNGRFLKGHTGGRPETAESYLRNEYSKLLPDTARVLNELMLNTDGVTPHNVRVSAIKLIVEYSAGKPYQSVNISTSTPDTSPAELTRLDMRARLDALDPVIIELEGEMQQAQEYQAFLESKAKKAKKEKVINE